jgi:hypothetical protein
MNLVVDLGQSEGSVEVKEVGRGHTSLKNWRPPALGSHCVPGLFSKGRPKGDLEFC